MWKRNSGHMKTELHLNEKGSHRGGMSYECLLAVCVSYGRGSIFSQTSTYFPTLECTFTYRFGFTVQLKKGTVCKICMGHG